MNINELFYLSALLFPILADLQTPSVRITGGEDAKITDFPGMVEIGLYEQEKYVHRCGGSYVQTKIVLTAAHCLDMGLSKKPELILSLGIYAKNNKEASRKSKVLLPHPNYTSNPKYLHDIAIIKMDKPFEKEIEFVDIPFNFSYAEGINVWILGWGGTQLTDIQSNMTSASVLQKLLTSIAFSGDENLFYVGKHLKNGCFGDSGGPVISNDSLIGILIGIQESNLANCDVGYTEALKITLYREWIQNAITNNSKIDTHRPLRFLTMCFILNYLVFVRHRTFMIVAGILFLLCLSTYSNK